MKPAICLVSLAALAAGSLLGQQVISAKAGLIHYVEGKVLLDGKAVEPKFAEYPQMKENSVLSSTEGRAELLMTPGVFLWLGEQSEMSLLSNRLSDTRLKLTKGSVLLEAAELPDGNAVTVMAGNAVVTLDKPGVYRLDAEPVRLMVYDGEAAVDEGGQVQRVKRSRLLMLDGTAVAEKFDKETGDALFRWAKRRGEYFAMANLSAAHSQSLRGSGFANSNWLWNPYFGMFTYVPYEGVYNSFWGHRYWSPQSVYMVYNPPRVSVPVGGGGRGWGDMNSGPRAVSQAPSGVSGVVSAAASAGAASPSPAPAASSSPRPGGGAAGGRSR
ncbi:MAG TPA: hypothetical protein VN428_25050 [Bryobacteraceae bacterium]|nr:hypothetical protein [Bryobacteraceae bacterium]